MIEVITGNEKILSAYGLEGSGCSLPAGQVGGDFFDFISCDNRTVFAVIGDVMGKGFHAARLMETIRYMLLECIRINPNPLEVVRRLNKVGGYELRKYGAFASLCLLCYDGITGRLSCVNAGHHPPLLLSGGEVKVARCRGVALGLLEDYLGSGVEEFFLSAGDAVVLYTDGLVEACGPGEQRYGQKRLREIVSLHHGAEADRIRKNILSDLETFTSGFPQKDDVTLVVIKVTEKAGERIGD
ncbi:PP2C family protein-serine/threonine phosphatase [Thermosediminibacter oceani]|uniref:Protein serine/threonine phosphatase n=1 Tax=Thermosediminibacter oceani (strain ATCC BAA-1034 / DSM 16646 / JW/IW-1228P) TaxID=555079 RepID=D9RY62_THEOJ|nr:PP2C family protein-serine/threonine phosphatase [Thermosediminibacter oceani]ADL08286.1 protein serine/threonine phosphatase [Thermosediminibacter oceani DSM 16646]